MRRICSLLFFFWITSYSFAAPVGGIDFVAARVMKKDRVEVPGPIKTAETIEKKKKTICLNMIVKNEKHVIERCLKSVKPIIDYWVIVDTGSSDGTQQVIKEYMKDIPGELKESPFVDFAYSRNQALNWAKGKGDYLLFIDADEELQYASGFSLPTLVNDFYYFNSQYGGTEYPRVQMINNSLPWKWIGVLHEYLDCGRSCSFAVLDGITNYVRAEGARSQDPLKFQKDAKVLEEALKAEPHNDRYLFYLAQTYQDGGESQKALETYKKRFEMGGWDQELFWCKYRIALLQEKLGASFEEVVKGYVDAHAYRPSRAEPLYYLANYLRMQGNYFLGYLVAKAGCQIPLSKDAIFVERWIYEYGLALERSVSGYWIGKYGKCLKISQELLKEKALPEHVRSCVESNVKWANHQLGRGA